MKNALLFLFSLLPFFSYSQIEIVYDEFEYEFAITDHFSTVLNGKYTFIHSRNTKDGLGIWVSDGTAEGTYSVAKTYGNFSTRHAVVFKNELYHIVEYGALHQRNLHKTGDVMGSEDTVAYKIWPERIAIIDSLLFFLKVDDSKVWRTDGTSAGTFSVNANSPVLPVAYNIGNGISFKGYYYYAKADSNGYSLWRTDGTAQGTSVFLNLNTYTYNTNKPQDFAIIGEELFFMMDGGIWKTDGTENGTVLIKQIPNYLKKSYHVGKNDAIILNGKYVIGFYTSDKGREFWVSDGTTAGTFCLDIYPNGGNALLFDPDRRNNVTVAEDGYMYFNANNGEHGTELWRTDGTLENTKMISDLTPGIRSSYYSHLQAIGNDLFFLIDLPNDDKGVVLAKINLTTLTPNPPAPNKQSVEWFKMFTNTPINRYMYQGDLATDSEHNVYITGESNSEEKHIIFANDDFLLPFDTVYESRYNSFLAKYKKDGELLWAIDYGSTRRTDNLAPIAVDREDNVIVADHFWKDASIYNIPYTALEYGLLVAKLDKNGQLLWTSSGHFLRGKVYDVAIDSKNDVYVSGYFIGTANFAGDEVVGYSDAYTFFMVKYSSSGELQWVETFPMSLYGHSTIQIYNDRLYLLASEGYWNWWSSCEYHDWNIYLKAYTLKGNLLWEEGFNVSDIAFANDMDITPNGIITLTGRYRGALSLQSNPTKNITSSTNEYCHNMHQFFAQFTPNGELVTLFQEDSINTITYDIEFDKQGNRYQVGIEYKDPIPIYEGFEHQPFPNGDNYLFVRKYDYLNNFLGERLFYKYRYYPKEEWYYNAPKLQLGADNELYISDVSRYQFDTLAFYTDSESSQELFLMKIKDDFSTVPNPPVVNNEPLEINISPNPSDGFLQINIINDDFLHHQLSVYDVTGRLVERYTKTDNFRYLHINLGLMSGGTYFLNFDNGKENITKRVVIY